MYNIDEFFEKDNSCLEIIELLTNKTKRKITVGEFTLNSFWLIYLILK